MISRSKSGDTVLLSLRIPAFVLYGRWFMEDIQGLGDGPALVGGVCIPSACGAVIGAWNVRDAKNGGKARVNITLMNVEDVLDWPVSEEAEYALWTVGHSKGDGKKLRLIGEGWHGSLAFALEKGECEAVIVGKVWMVKERQVAVIGLLDKFGSLAGLQSGVKDGECDSHFGFFGDCEFFAADS